MVALRKTHGSSAWSVSSDGKSAVTSPVGTKRRVTSRRWSVMVVEGGGLGGRPGIRHGADRQRLVIATRDRGRGHNQGRQPTISLRDRC